MWIKHIKNDNAKLDNLLVKKFRVYFKDIYTENWNNYFQQNTIVINADKKCNKNFYECLLLLKNSNDLKNDAESQTIKKEENEVKSFSQNIIVKSYCDPKSYFVDFKENEGKLDITWKFYTFYNVRSYQRLLKDLNN